MLGHASAQRFFERPSSHRPSLELPLSLASTLPSTRATAAWSMRLPALLVPTHRRWLMPALAIGLVAQGCGPSFEAIQEGDLRFAHCDRLDLDPNIAPSHRLHCWREWRRVYTYGQTRDRVEYAQRRIAEVLSGDPDPPFELPTGSSRRPDGRSPTIRSPVHSPPPAVVPMEGGGSVLSDEPSEGKFGPGCRSRCAEGRAACAPGCETQPTGCQDCDVAFHACLGNCETAPP
jgi:hypothetical protein